VKQVDNLHYFIAHGDGIYFYDYSSNSLTPFISGLAVHSIEYDDLQQEVFACSGHSLNVYNASNGAFEYTVASPDSVMDARILYNR
jgi:hypothetical protein